MTGSGGEHTTEHQEPREVRVSDGHSAAAGHGGGAAAEQRGHGAAEHDGGAHGIGDHGAGAQDDHGGHGAGDQGADAHGGHGGHGDEMALGPIDVTAWSVGLAGVVIGLAVALCFALSTGYIG